MKTIILPVGTAMLRGFDGKTATQEVGRAIASGAAGSDETDSADVKATHKAEASRGQMWDAGTPADTPARCCQL